MIVTHVQESDASEKQLEDYSVPTCDSLPPTCMCLRRNRNTVRSLNEHAASSLSKY
jgi:hypothetical protein